MIKIKARNLDKVSQMISRLPREIRGGATKEAGVYLIGNERRGLKHYPSRVIHGEGNPYQWQSEKQRRAFFATNGFGGGIPYSRTNSLKAGWKIIEGGVQTKVVNNLPYASFVMGSDQQRGHRADKWRTIPEVIIANTQGMLRAIKLFVDRWIKTNEVK